MIIDLDTCPPGAIPIRHGEIPVTLHPAIYVAKAEKLGYQVVRCAKWFYLVRVH